MRIFADIYYCCLGAVISDHEEFFNLHIRADVSVLPVPAGKHCSGGCLSPQTAEYNRNRIVEGAVLGVSLSGALGFTVIALRYTTAANVAFITGMNIVIVPFLSNIILKKRIDWKKEEVY